MNQTKKRLSIIKLAISITDIDCIQHQILKLSQLKSDHKLQEILEMLQAKNYAQAQGLITDYIDTPMDQILQRSSQEEMRGKEENALMDEFELFEEKGTDEANEIEKIEDIHAYISQEIPPTKSYESAIDYDALLTLNADDILPDNIEIDISTEKEPDKTEDDFFRKAPVETDKNHKDTFFNTNFTENESVKPKNPTPPVVDEKKEKEKEKEESIQQQKIKFSPMPYIEEKFQNMLKQYPPVIINKTTETSVKTLIEKIKYQNYTEKEIEETLHSMEILIKNNQKSESAKLLLLTASTPSLFAQFMLARALFKGEILQKNIPEAFSIIYKLANDELYPEAICDLAQLYEYGIGVEKDIKKAEALYSEAMELGIQRAKSHVERIRKENKGLFSLFKK